jgi:hypothetical protein
MQRSILVVVSLCALSVASAQSTGNPGGATENGSADQQWQIVKNKGEPITSLNSSDPASRSQAISTYIADADALKDFYTKNPDSARVTEARRREALALLYARSLGDSSQKGRGKQLVLSLRKDASVDLEKREQLAAFSDNLDVDDRRIVNAKDQLLAYEQTARALQTEFPTSVSIYESLNAIAQASADDHATIVAQDILKMSAPAEAKGRAQLLLTRLALKGTSVTNLATEVLGADNAFQRALGKPLVIYSWSASSPEFLGFIKGLVSKVPPGTAFIGVCVDMGDLTAARARVAKDQPPGEQFYDPMGFAGKLAGRAQLSAPGLVYLADPKGTLISVSAQRDLSAVPSALSNL